VPFEKLVEELKPERDLRRSPLFQVVFGMHNAPSQSLALPDLNLQLLHSEHDVVRFDLTLQMMETGGRLGGTWTYSRDLFEPATVARMHSHFETLLRSIVAQPDAAISELQMISEAEKEERELRKRARHEAMSGKLKTVRRKAPAD
jgi:non-ribosomal peptide synthetase component F